MPTARPDRALLLHLRPDGRCVARPPGHWTDRAARSAADEARHRGVEVIVTIDARQISDRAALEAAGFRIVRTEAVLEIGVAKALAALETAMLPTGIGVRSASEVDVDALRELDDELRDDVPGTAGWRSAPYTFRDDTFTASFDPRTYLVGVDEATGDLVAIVRVWMNDTGPRIGLWGVRRNHRRRGIAALLLRHALAAVASTGASTVTTEVDLTNRPSAALAARLGAREVGRMLELSSSPPVGPAGGTSP